MANVYVGDTATTITIAMGTDVSSATTVAVDVYKPDTLTAEVWAATASTTNIVVTVDGTTRAFDVAGMYRLQPVITFLDGGSGWSGKGEMVWLRVHPVGE